MVAAVAMMMEIAMKCEKAIPTSVSKRILRNCDFAPRPCNRSDRCSVVVISSASWELCQKNRYGLMVVPKTATIVSSA